jgi:SAM-dependent methyltransferase
MTPRAFRVELDDVPPGERDAWLDQALGLDSIPEDGPSLPPLCVPYLPCSVAALLHVLDEAQVGASDVFVDVGSGVGRAAALVHLSTGASVVGIEIQPELIRVSRELAERLSLHRFTSVEGDAVELAPLVTNGTVFFLFCPFSGARLEKLLDNLEPIARTRRIRVGVVDMPLPRRSWLRLLSSSCEGATVYESTLVSRRNAAS